MEFSGFSESANFANKCGPITPSRMSAAAPPRWSPGRPSLSKAHERKTTKPTNTKRKEQQHAQSALSRTNCIPSHFTALSVVLGRGPHDRLVAQDNILNQGQATSRLNRVISGWTDTSFKILVLSFSLAWPSVLPPVICSRLSLQGSFTPRLTLLLKAVPLEHSRVPREASQPPS